jgi:enoyl-CoA hydratase/carnithine racemase
MPLLIQRDGAVTELALDWPEVRNALGPLEGRELRLALEAAVADESLAAIVISARGKAFCAGGNLREIVRLAQQGADAVRASIYGEFQGIVRAIRGSPVPVIAAVDGAAVGFGCDLSLAGNVTFIGAQGFISQGWVKAGLIPATGGTLYVAQRAGQQAVWRLLAADRVDGPTAESWGLAIACDNARSSALAMAATLAALPRQPVRAVTQLSRIEDPGEHLARALEFQIGFITGSEFARMVKTLLDG